MTKKGTKPDLTLPTEAEMEEMRAKARKSFKRRLKESQAALKKSHAELPPRKIKKWRRGK